MTKSSRRTPFWQMLLLPLLSVVIFFALVEAGLAVFGVKPALQTNDPFVGFVDNVPLFIPDSDDGQFMVTAPNRLAFFNEQAFPRQKTPGTFRIFCLGGSTTYGRPYSDSTSFAGWLRKLLPKADQTKDWEVINAGGISYASYRVAHLMEELVAHQPDMFIIYTGHNEFLEERTYGKLREIPALVRSTAALLARTRTWTALNNALQRLGSKTREPKESRDQLTGEVNTILARSAGLDRYTRDDRLRENVLQHYRISLEHMVKLAQSVDARIIFVTPASNLKDSSPFKSEHTAGLDAAGQQQSERLLNESGAAMAREDWYGALASLDTALEFDPRHAELLYRRGQTLLKLHQFEAAEQSLLQARDEDVCPLRALTETSKILAEVARENGIALVDFIGLLQQRMQKSTGQSVPGEEFFLDHVHPTIEGNKLLAAALVDTMIDQQLVQSGRQWPEPAITAAAAEIDSLIDQRAHSQAIANLARVLNWAGKIEDAARLAKQAMEQASEYPQIMANAASVLTSIYRKEGNPERALQTLISAVEIAPKNIELRFKLGMIQLDPPFRRVDEAAANLLLATHQLPNNDLAYLTFGLAMAERGRLRIAYPSFVEAKRLNPKNVEADQALAKMNMVLGGQLPDPQLPRTKLEKYPSGVPHKLVQYRLDSSGRVVRDGLEAEWYETGHIKRIADFEFDLPNGYEITWGRDGKLVSRVEYRNGLKGP